MAHIFTFASCIMHQITKDCAKQDTSLDSSKNIAYYVHVDFLGPRGPLVLPSVGSFVRPVRPSRKKNVDHLYTGIYAL